MMPALSLLFVALLWASILCPLQAQVQQWNNAQAVAGDLLVVANFTDNFKDVPRHSKSKSSTKSSKSGSYSKGTISSKSGSSDRSSTSSESTKRDTTSDTGSSDSSKSKSSPSSKSSESTPSDSTKSRPSESSSSDSTRDPSKTSENSESKESSESTASKDSKDDHKASDDTKPSKDSEDDPTGSDSEDDTQASDETKPSEDSGDDPTDSDSEDDTQASDETKPSEDSEDDSDSEDDTQASDETKPSEDSEDDPTDSDSEDDTQKPASSPTREPTTDGAGANEVPTKDPAAKDNVFETPSISPTYYPTATPRCELNALGAYGTVSNDRREYEFFYQVETTSDVTQSILTNELMPPLEREIGTRLVAALFDECGADQRRLQAKEEDCDAVGFSRLPVDRALAGVPCLPDSRQDVSNTCYAVDGGVRLFLEGECDNADDLVMATIRKVVEQGTYSRIDPRIINVIYLDISDIDLDKQVTRSGSGGSSSTKVPGWAIILLTVVGLGLVVSLLLFLGRRKPQDKNGFDTLPDDEGDEEY